MLVYRARMNVRLHICIRAYIYESVYVCMYVSMYVCNYVSMYVCTYACAFMCVFVHAHVCTRMALMHVHTFVCIYI